MRFLLTYLLLPLIFWFNSPGLSPHAVSAANPTSGKHHLLNDKATLLFENIDPVADVPQLSLLNDDNENEDEDEDERSTSPDHRHSFEGTWLPCPDHLLITSNNCGINARPGHTTKAFSSFSTGKYILYQVFRI